MTVLLPLELGHLTSLDKQASLQVESRVVEVVHAQTGRYSFLLCEIELDRSKSRMLSKQHGGLGVGGDHVSVGDSVPFADFRVDLFHFGKVALLP